MSEWTEQVATYDPTFDIFLVALRRLKGCYKVVNPHSGITETSRLVGRPRQHVYKLTTTAITY